VVTHGQLAAQIQALLTAWTWTQEDRILNVLPLHHVHGMVNVYGCALWSGARVIELGGFDARKTWEALLQHRPTLFMAVPTVYQKLADAHAAADEQTRLRWSGACQNARLMVSGSAALSPALLKRWHSISGHVLLERYGMTEIGMALSNPLNGLRVPGAVGFPIPGVFCRLTEEAGGVVEGEGTGELQVKGASVFQGYWNKPEASAADFDGPWFKTGDLAQRDGEGRYRILGRLSVDLIKTGGFKVAAPEIEATLLEHPAIAECAVLGVPDVLWGQQVAVALVLRPGQALGL
jgi:malonyl-CoA/methylmalonyl-CoA synthetase